MPVTTTRRIRHFALTLPTLPTHDEEEVYVYPFSPDMMEEEPPLLVPFYPGYFQLAYNNPLYYKNPSNQQYFFANYPPTTTHDHQAEDNNSFSYSPSDFIAPNLLRRSLQDPIGYDPKQFHSDQVQLSRNQFTPQFHYQPPTDQQQDLFHHIPPAAGPSTPTKQKQSKAGSTTKRSSSSGSSLRTPSRVGVYEAVYSNIPVYELICNGVAVMRRQSDSYINATHILKVAGIEKGKRTKILEREIHSGVHEKVQGGYGKYQGTWVPMTRAQELAHQYHVADILHDILYLPSTERDI
ncbi:transcriptional regulator swi6 [Nowakowskiella sp. JEL0407]|nr:transcriptional regulator swi6 [Nowakowskiella sp. JEL0407]